MVTNLPAPTLQVDQPDAETLEAIAALLSDARGGGGAFAYALLSWLVQRMDVLDVQRRTRLLRGCVVLALRAASGHDDDREPHSAQKMRMVALRMAKQLGDVDLQALVLVRVAETFVSSGCHPEAVEVLRIASSYRQLSPLVTAEVERVRKLTE